MNYHKILFATIIGATLTCASVLHAAIAGIGSLGSGATVTFDDTNSITPALFSGSSYSNSVAGWTGTPLTLTPPAITDATTGDFATGAIDATFTPFTSNYFLNLSGVTLTQQVLNTGMAKLTYTFNIDYQLDGFGMAPQPTMFPNFLVTGTVQPAAGSFASFTGQIDYYGTIQTTAGLVPAIYETVMYSGLWNTPGLFSAPVFGVPSVGTTPAFIPFTTMNLTGNFTFIVDPASISLTTIPEPSTYVLGGMSLLGLLVYVGRRKQQALTMAG